MVHDDRSLRVRGTGPLPVEAASPVLVERGTTAQPPPSGFWLGMSVRKSSPQTVRPSCGTWGGGGRGTGGRITQFKQHRFIVMLCRQVLTLLDNFVAHLGVRFQGDVRRGGCHQNYQQNGGSLVGLEAERGRVYQERL